MNTVYYEEIRKNNELIRKCRSKRKRDLGYKRLCTTLDKIVFLSIIARHEGLLALEEEAYKLMDLPEDDYLRDMLLLVVDGAEPYMVEDIFTIKYYALGLKGYEAILYIMMLEGCLAIQNGETPYNIVKLLRALTSEEISTDKLYYEEYYQMRKDSIVPENSEEASGEDGSDDSEDDPATLTPEDVKALLSKMG